MDGYNKSTKCLIIIQRVYSETIVHVGVQAEDNWRQRGCAFVDKAGQGDGHSYQWGFDYGESGQFGGEAEHLRLQG